ncbi:MAG: GAF domain-containing protein [Chloroflexaceae bacterium]|nr:GAF domain-containing protein [Chloroflexaceae bacterium]
MTSDQNRVPTPTTHPLAPRGGLRYPRFLRNLKIGSKLTIAFGLLVSLTLLVVGLSFFASEEATGTIDQTSRVRVPVALASSEAQANLLRMVANTRAYLTLGDDRFLRSYQQAEYDFRQDLEQLELLAPNFDSVNDQDRLDQVRESFDQWDGLPEELFALRSDQMEREPAYALLNTEGTNLAGSILLSTTILIDQQAAESPSLQGNILLRDMAAFQSSFAAMFSGLRGYVTTRNPNFRAYEYESNLTLNEEAWRELLSQRDQLSAEQQTLLDGIAGYRQEFLDTIPGEVIDIMQDDNRYRLDLALFRTKAVPLTDEMQQLLLEITNSQQEALQRELESGRNALIGARRQTLIWGGFALVLGILLAIVFRYTIVGPVRRVTSVAEDIRAGNLDVSAQVESGDEIGVFAETFNSMTVRLRDTMNQIRKEKQRSDSLLNVVIPIGVALSSERNFNHLLENMLTEAMTFCHADRGAILLREGDMLRFVMLRGISQQVMMGGTSGQLMTIEPLQLNRDPQETEHPFYPSAYAAITGGSINIANINQDSGFDVSIINQIDTQNDYHTVSFLALPIKNNQQEVLGVLELVNAQDAQSGQVMAFDANLQQLMESFSSLAAAALEAYIREQELRQEIQQLRIEIDETRRQKEVQEIVETDFFQDLQAKARRLRRRQNNPEE